MYKRQITSTVDNCLSLSCDYYDECFVVKARRQAQAAQLVVVNHHLLLADLSLKETGFGDLLPAADIVIVDEAHHFPEVAQQFFDTSLSIRELQHLSADISAEARLKGLAREVELKADELIHVTADTYSKNGEFKGRRSWVDCPEPLKFGISQWQSYLQSLGKTLEVVREVSTGLARCCERVQDLIARLETFENADAEINLRWVEIHSRNLILHCTPMNIGNALGERIQAQGGRWVFTSATLAVGSNFDHFLDRVGISDAHTCLLPSPFDYERNTRLYLPKGLPVPAEATFIPQTVSYTHLTLPTILLV